MAQQLLIFLPDTAVGDEDTLIEEFFRFVHYCIVDERSCDFATVRGPEVNAYCALYYEAQVNNGGHAQFIGNADNDLHIFEAALSGLAQIEAWPQEAILRNMITWIQENREDVDMLMNSHLFSPVRPKALDSLDTHFFNENGVSPIKTRVKNWIEQAPNLRVIPENDFLALLENPGSIRPN